MTKRDLAGRLARWSLTLQEFNIAIFYKSGKAHLDADCLSRYPVGQPSEEEEDDRCLLIAAAFSFSLHDPNQPYIQELADAQDDEPAWKAAKEALREGKKAGAYRLLGDRLYRQSIVSNQLVRRLCLPAKYRMEVLRRYHDEVTSAHLGLNRCLHQLKKRFFWPCMARSVQKYIRACKSCQARKGIADKPAGLLQCIRAARPFQRVGMDLLGPFPLSKKGNRQIVVIFDYLTKWAEVKAMPTGTAVDVANVFVEQVFVRHGAPEQLITDRGKCFVAEIMQAVAKLLTTNHRTTSAFNPSCNGQVERLNHVLADMLSMYVSSDHTDWDETLPYVTFAYNTSRQESTGFSPFYLLYGREPILPADLSFGVDPNPLIPMKEAATTYIRRLQSNLETARQTVLVRMEQVKKKQKLTYDATRRETTYNKNDLVLIYKPLRKIGRSEKLLHRWLGPYLVVRQTTPVNYEVILQSGRQKSDIVQLTRMKPFFDLEALSDEEIDRPATVDQPTTTDEKGNPPREVPEPQPISPTQAPPHSSLSNNSPTPSAIECHDLDPPPETNTEEMDQPDAVTANDSTPTEADTGGRPSRTRRPPLDSTRTSCLSS
jgi:transposase InsO family protein